MDKFQHDTVAKVLQEYSKFKKEVDKQKLEVFKKLEKLDSFLKDLRDAAMVSIRNILELQDGDSVVFDENGNFEVRRGIVEDDKVELNGKEITRKELEEKKEQLKDQKGVKLEEVGKDKYKIKLQG